MTAPSGAEVTELDQAVIDAGRELARAHLEQPPNRDRIDAARATLQEARAARWPHA